MSKFIDVVFPLLKEPSTWRGIALLITACGIALNPDQIAAITAAGLGITGAIGAFVSDQPPDQKPQP